jgi:DNA adenine methylase
MAYVGGKSKGAEHIIDILNQRKYNGMHYMEPFVGYGHILRRVKNKMSYTASDSNELLISLLQGIQSGVKYHKMHVTKECYDKLKKKSNDKSFRRALAGFAYSYNGKLWGGYTFSSATRENYPLERKKYYDVLGSNETFKGTKISCVDYSITLKPKNKLIYCDPPYQNTTGYGNPFDHVKFWNTMRKWSKSNIVYVSEYNAPPDFKCVAKLKKHNSLNGKGAGKVVYEKLFTMRAPPKAKVAPK